MLGPVHVMRLRREAFQSSVVGLGSQLVEIVELVAKAAPLLTWYAADVPTFQEGPPDYSATTPALVGDADAVIRTFQHVGQFEAGVFAGVPAGNARSVFRADRLGTEDDEAGQLGDAVIEIRAFDTSYWFIATTDVELAHVLQARFAT